MINISQPPEKITPRNIPLLEDGIEKYGRLRHLQDQTKNTFEEKRRRKRIDQKQGKNSKEDGLEKVGEDRRRIRTNHASRAKWEKGGVICIT